MIKIRLCILGVYVDDILLTGKKEEIINTKSLLKEHFEITDIGPEDYILGIKFEKHNDGYLLHPEKYLNDILERFEMNECKPVSNMQPVENKKLQKIRFNSKKYKQAIGSLLYLAICIRPDILFSVNKASRKANEPTLEDWVNERK